MQYLFKDEDLFSLVVGGLKFRGLVKDGDHVEYGIQAETQSRSFSVSVKVTKGKVNDGG